VIAEELNDGPASPAWRTRAWGIVGALSVTETVSWGILYYAFAVFLLPMQQELGYSAAQLAGAFSLALLVSAVAGIAVGRHLDRRGPRALMTAGSITGVVLVLAWSQVHGLAAFYLLWAGIGVVMAAVLYEPAFVVLAKWFSEPGERRRAMTAMTLVAALASFIFLPLAQALIDAHGWRDALVIPPRRPSAARLRARLQHELRPLCRGIAGGPGPTMRARPGRRPPDNFSGPTMDRVRPRVLGSYARPSVAAQSRYRKIAHSTASHNGVIASGPGPDVATPPAPRIARRDRNSVSRSSP